MYCGSPNVWAWSHADIVKYDNCVEYNIISKQWEWKKRTELRSDRPAAALNGAVKRGKIETETSCVSVLNTHAHSKNINDKMPYVLIFIWKKRFDVKTSRKISTDRYNISFLYRDPSHIVVHYMVFIFASYTSCKKKKMKKFSQIKQ